MKKYLGVISVFILLLALLASSGVLIHTSDYVSNAILIAGIVLSFVAMLFSKRGVWKIISIVLLVIVILFAVAFLS